MRQLSSRGFGKLHCDAEVIEEDSGKIFLIATVEFENRTLYNGKQYAQRVTFRSFDEQDISRVGELRKGVYMLFDGDTDAIAEKSATGWWYANPRVTGRILDIMNYASDSISS